MSRYLRWLAVLGGLIGLIALARWGASVVGEFATRSARAAADSTAKAEQARSRAVVDSLQRRARQLADWSAQERAKSAQAMAQSAQHKRDAALAGDSISVLLAQLGARDSQGTLVPVNPAELLDTIALAATCEERYRLRTVAGLRLELALTACEQAQSIALFRGDSLQGELYRQADRFTGEFSRNDSLWQARYDAKRCTRDWLLVHPPCWVADLGIASVSFTGGVLVAK